GDRVAMWVPPGRDNCCRIVENTSRMGETARRRRMERTDEAARERTTTEAGAIASVPTGLFIDGEWRSGSGTMPVQDPATGAVLCEVADADETDALTALDSAHRAQRDWAATAPRERSEILSRAHEMVMADTDRLALIMTLEMGKPLAESRGDVSYAAEFLRWLAEEAVRIDGGQMTAPAGGARFLITRQPVGPSLLITPWNFPMAMGTRKIGPAIAAGCTSVIKPAGETPLSALALVEILVRAGLPAGVVNVVSTSRAGEGVVSRILVARSRTLWFTGATE